MNNNNRQNGGESKELLRLATLERKDGEEQIRVSLDEFVPRDGKASRYVSIRLWYHDKRAGEWRPTQKGVTIRRGELAETLKGLQSGAAMIDAKGPARNDDQTDMGGLF